MPKTYVCFCCGKTFDKAEVCAKCGWRICPHCGGCLCKLSASERRVAVAVWKTYAPKTRVPAIPL